MEVRSWKIITYYVLKVIINLLINQIKSIQLEDKVMDYVINAYPRGM